MQRLLTTVFEPGNGQVRAALLAVAKSETFAGALRLQEFLTYVVEEKLAGRQNRIRGKTIAADVYNRKIGGAREGDKVVRVDASRLRRRLDQYYASEGQQDAIRITIPLGAYAPEIISQTNQLTETTGPLAQSPASVKPPHVSTHLPSTGKTEMKRRAIFEKSPASLQAFKFAQQARGMIWPPSDPVRMNAALDLFERAIALDDKYFGGYSGAATIYAFKAMLPGQGDRDPMLAKARDLASKAREMNPAEAWVQSALAWIAFVEKDYDRSEKLSVQSLILDPDDLFALEFHGVMQILSGEFEGGLASLEPIAANLEQTTHLNFMNGCIVAYFYLGRYADTITNVLKLGEMGGDISPLLMVYLSAAYQALGEGNSAQAVVHDLQSAWPTFQPDKLLPRIFRYPEHPQAVLDLLYGAGWSSN